MRCTVCTWRGPWVIAESAPRIRASEIPPSLEQAQNVLEEVQSEIVQVGGHHPPPCPVCGHHTVAVRLHGYAAAG